MHDDERMGKSLQILAGKNNVKTASLYMHFYTKKSSNLVAYLITKNCKNIEYVGSCFAESVYF